MGSIPGQRSSACLAAKKQKALGSHWLAKWRERKEAEGRQALGSCRLGLKAGAPGQGCSERIHLYISCSLRLELTLPCSYAQPLRNAFPDCPFSSYKTHTNTACACLAEINTLVFVKSVYFLFFVTIRTARMESAICIAASLAPSPTQDKFEE